MAKRRAKKKGGVGLEHIGSWAFIVGVVLAVLLGIVSGLSGVSAGTALMVGSVLVLLGLIVGLLNVTHHEASEFLWASTALVLVSWLAAQLGGGSVFASVWGAGVLNGLLSAIITFVVPAAVVVAVRAVYSAARHP
jgi:hypothetical protein